MTPETDRFIDVDGVRVRYWSLGDRGRPVVLIHGIGGYIESWGTTIEALASRHRVWVLDLPGHGLSDHPIDFSQHVKDHASFVTAFLETQGIRQVSVVGHSLGGAIAAHMAITVPDRIDRLALVSSVGWGRDCHIFFRVASVPYLGELLMRPTRSGTADAVKLLVQDPAAKSSEALEFDYQMAIRPGSRSSFLKALRQFCGWSGQRRELCGSIFREMPAFSKPVLILWGRQDQLIPVAHAAEAASVVRHAEVRVLEACGHLPMLEHPETFNRALLDFLE